VVSGAGGMEGGLMRSPGSDCRFSNTFTATGANCTTDWDCRMSNGFNEFCVGGKCGLDRNLCNANGNMGMTDRRSGNCGRTNSMVSTYSGTCGSSVSRNDALCASPQICYKDADCNGGKAGQCAAIVGSAASSCQCNGGFAGCPSGYSCSGGRCVYGNGCQNPGGAVVIDPSTPSSG